MKLLPSVKHKYVIHMPALLPHLQINFVTYKIKISIFHVEMLYKIKYCCTENTKFITSLISVFHNIFELHYYHVRVIK